MSVLEKRSFAVLPGYHFCLNCPCCRLVNVSAALHLLPNRYIEKSVDRRNTSSHDNKKFRTRSMEKQRGMAFGFRKTATAVRKSDRYIIYLFT